MIRQKDIHIHVKEKKSCPEVDNFNSRPYAIYSKKSDD